MWQVHMFCQHASVYDTFSCLDPDLWSHVTYYTMPFYVEILLLRLTMIGDKSRYLATVTVHYSFFKCCHLGEILCLCKTAVNNVNNEMNGTERGEVGNYKQRRNTPAHVKHHKPWHPLWIPFFSHTGLWGWQWHFENGLFIAWELEDGFPYCVIYSYTLEGWMPVTNSLISLSIIIMS